MSKRKEILDTAAKCVCGDRDQDYGSPENNFTLIAKLWTDYLGTTNVILSAQDVASMMILMKLSRIRNGGGTGDSYVDIAGYAACGGEIFSNKTINNDKDNNSLNGEKIMSMGEWTEQFSSIFDSNINDGIFSNKTINNDKENNSNE